MPSPPRDTTPGLHHFWVNATSHWPYFTDDADRLTWIRLLVRTLRRHEYRCVAFCQMTTHVHGILDVHDRSLPEAMRYLNREYSRRFNARHARWGHLVRKRYGSRRIEGRDDLLGTYAYVVLNPVVEGMCARAEDWRWSSYATTLELNDDFPFVDASIVVAELGSLEALRRLVDGRQRERMAIRATSR